MLIQSGMKMGIDMDTLENDDPVVGGFNQLSLSQDAENVTVLGSGLRSDITFEWMVAPWSECSQSCGPEIGYKVFFKSINDYFSRARESMRNGGRRR